MCLVQVEKINALFLDRPALQLQATFKRLCRERGCQPWRAQAPLFSQIPLWITMLLCLSRVRCSWPDRRSAAPRGIPGAGRAD